MTEPILRDSKQPRPHCLLQ